MKYVGAGLELGPAPTSDSDNVPAMVQQDGADPGRTVYVQFTGDAAPSGLVKGDIVIQEA